MQKNNSNILNRMFTRNTFFNCFENGNDIVYRQTIKKYVNNNCNKTNLELISEIYSLLKKEYRNEYYYKNTLLNKLLLGVHNINTTTALTEIPIAKSKADFVLINGKAVVYEIKTDLDNFERLENQLNDYFKAFDHVAVVTSESNITSLEKKLNSIEKPIGIYILKQKGTLSTIKKPQQYENDLDIEIIFKVLRKYEYEDILLQYYGYLPQVSEFKYYSECKELFCNMSLEDIYPKFLGMLKNRNKIIKEEFNQIPYELKFLAYFMNLNLNDYKKIKVFLNERYGGV